MKTLPSVLVCEDDVLFQYAVQEALRDRYECVFACNGDEALEILRKSPIKLVLLDIQMRTPNEGLHYLPKLLEIDPDLSVIISSQFRDFGRMREAMVFGAIDYVPKDFDTSELLHSLDRAVERQKIVRRNQQHNFEARCEQRNYPFVGTSAWANGLRGTIEKVRRGHANVVITGETGTGKEIVARQLRKSLPNGTLEPFVAVDSATIQSSTAESALFGHERGAFTGADRMTKGYFEEAEGGVIYFDEISNMPLEIQAKLLRVLQEKEVRRLGSNKVIQLNFRVICASNKDLKTLCENGKFKEDLYQRLNVLPIRVIPLRERPSEIPGLLDHFSEKFHSPFGRLRFTPEAIEVLSAYSWPGNIRELSNLVYCLRTKSSDR
jgi:DNA-binding NtrC family response regulator